MAGELRKLRVAVLGDLDAGKTALISQYSLKNHKFDPIDLQFTETDDIDLCLDEGFDAFILIFNITSRKSFANIQLYANTIVHCRPQQHNIALVGTRADLNEERVTYEEGLGYAETVGADYVHLSVDYPERVGQVFQFLLRRFDQLEPATNAKVSNLGNVEKNLAWTLILDWIHGMFTACSRRREAKKGSWLEW